MQAAVFFGVLQGLDVHFRNGKGSNQRRHLLNRSQDIAGNGNGRIIGYSRDPAVKRRINRRIPHHIAGSLDGLLQLGDLFVVHSRSFLDLDGLRRFTLRRSRRTAGISHHLVVFNFR